MSAPFRLRQATADDAAAIVRLEDASPDGGRVQFRVREHAQIRPAGDGLTRSLGVVATDRSGQHLVGSARAILGTFQYEGQERPFVQLVSLKVHPNHRRQGIGAALAQWRIAAAERTAGPDVVILADIQQGNEASLGAARRWATAFTPPALTIPVPMRRKPPREPAGLRFRPADQKELAAVARGVMHFTEGHNFARVWTAERLATWLRWSPLDVPVRHYAVAVDQTGVIVAGLALREEALLRTMELTRMPATIRAVNRFVRVVPKDGHLRNLNVEHLWFTPGDEDAAAALWQQVRWTWRERGTNLLITIDARSPVRELLDIRPWTPKTSITIAVRAHPTPEPARLIAPVE